MFNVFSENHWWGWSSHSLSEEPSLLITVWTCCIHHLNTVWTSYTHHLNTVWTFCIWGAEELALLHVPLGRILQHPMSSCWPYVHTHKLLLYIRGWPQGPFISRSTCNIAQCCSGLYCLFFYSLALCFSPDVYPMQMAFCNCLRGFSVVNNTGLQYAYRYELLLQYIMDYWLRM